LIGVARTSPLLAPNSVKKWWVPEGSWGVGSPTEGGWGTRGGRGEVLNNNPSENFKKRYRKPEKRKRAREKCAVKRKDCPNPRGRIWGCSELASPTIGTTTNCPHN